jgi:hypothetical protein
MVDRKKLAEAADAVRDWINGDVIAAEVMDRYANTILAALEQARPEDRSPRLSDSQ